VPRALPALIVVAAVCGAVAVGLAERGRDGGPRCGRGFLARGARCIVGTGAECPPPLVGSSRGCGAPDVRVLVPAASIAIGPSDWEAERRVAPRVVHVRAFRIDAFEVTCAHWEEFAHDGTRCEDGARAASGIARDRAAAYCAARGGRLPTEDEWIVAAAAAAGGAGPARRYPWGDTGAVCRRAAWGLRAGPCAHGADGPDTVGAHPDGDSPLGLHDLAGNVAEWVAATPAASDAPDPPDAPSAPDRDEGVAKGGSWASELASDLRAWARLELAPTARDGRVGFRCAYPP